MDQARKNRANNISDAHHGVSHLQTLRCEQSGEGTLGRLVRIHDTIGV